YALNNLDSRYRMPMEAAPGYNNIRVKEKADYGDVFNRAVRDVFTDRRANRMFDAVLDQKHLGGTITASAGDSGSVHGGVVGADPQTFQIASRYYNDPRYAALLAKMKASGANSFRSWDALFRPPVEAPPDVKPAPAPARPRLLDGGGLAILNNKADTISLALSYGQTHGHGHYDRLNFELFANGLPMLPDLGYPDAMNQFVSGIYTWSQNTIAHNTVVVDGRRQFGTQAGDVKMFASGDFARGVDVEAKQTYGQCSSYRRAMIMVDAPGDSAGNSYFVDVFTVAGREQHDYSLHGPPGKFEMIGGQWSEPAKGTLAGENVALGAIYDDEKLAAAKGGFAAYAGSGFQHLFNVRTLQNDGGGGAGEWVAQFKHERDENAMVRLRILDQPDMKTMLCDARVSPVKDPRVLKYLIARRSGPEPLASRFVSVIEPFREKPFIRSVTPLKLDDDEGGAGVAIAVERVDGQTDVVMYDPAGARKRLRARGIDTRAEIAVTTFAADEKRPTRSFRVFATVASGRASVAKVVGVMPISSAIEIAAADPNRPFDAADLPGRVIHFVNDRHRTAHTVASVARVPDSNHYLLTLADDIVVGLAKVDKIQADELTTATALPLISAYRGATLADDLFRFQHPLKYARNGTIKLASPLPANHPIKPGDNVWLMDVGVGDSVEIPLIRDIKLK
ncbi:MAG: hypothetical protein QOE14_1146, partial [Humisphaera sp.]|nr:hypothetical protein [Humisphaera sp.]